MFKSFKRWLAGAPQPAPVPKSDTDAAASEHSLDAYREGLALFQAGNLAASERCLNQALAYQHDFAQAHYYLGLVYRKQQRLEDASDALLLATTFKPEFAEAWFYLGIVALDTERFEEAAKDFNTALQIRPDYAEAYNGLGKLCEMQMQLRAAEDYFKRAIALNPRFAIAYNNLAHVVLRKHFDDGAAYGYVKKALELDPALAGAHNNLAMILQFQGWCEEALAACERALELDPQAPNTLFVRALAQLMIARFAEGWRDYEARKRLLPTFKVRRFPYPEWDGSDLAGRDVLVYYEQGIGDEIMFASCLPDLFARGGRCVVECSAKLERLFRRSFSAALIQVSDQSRPDMSYLQALPRFDWQVAAGSLPHFFRRRSDDFPAHAGYLQADTARVEFWRSRLDKLGPGRKVGLSWRGGGEYNNYSIRSIELEKLLPILSIPGIEFVSLQYGNCLEEIESVRARHGVALHHSQDAIDDYDETAALVGALDLVVSVQTAIVHLSGALGKPAWVLVPATPEWRYMASGERMPWYPSVRLFRQSPSRDWGTVIARIAHELTRVGAATA